MSAALFSKKEEKAKKTKPSKEVEVQSEAIEASEPSSPAVPRGEDSEAYRFVLSPHITEKATNANILNKYTFKVSDVSNKIEVKKAIEKLYGVKVLSINIQNMPSKSRQVGRYLGTKSGFKKAIVTLKEGQKIEVV